MNSFKHQFLLAMPHLIDPSFEKGLTFICEHSKEGALGLVVNKPLDLTFAELTSQIGIHLLDTSRTQVPIFAGGPVHNERGFVLHTNEGKWSSSISLGEGLYLTTSLDILEALAAGAGPDQFIITLGCASWQAGQLEQEFLDNAWLTTAATQEILFNTPIEEKLNAAALNLGVNLSQLTSQVGYA